LTGIAGFVGLKTRLLITSCEPAILSNEQCSFLGLGHRLADDSPFYRFSDGGMAEELRGECFYRFSDSEMINV
jgi:hypothetical protein